MVRDWQQATLTSVGYGAIHKVRHSTFDPPSLQSHFVTHLGFYQLWVYRMRLCEATLNSKTPKNFFKPRFLPALFHQTMNILWERNHNLQKSKAPLESHAQGTSFSTGADRIYEWVEKNLWDSLDRWSYLFPEVS